MTLSHIFGATTIESAPKRIATLGYASHDVCIALGVVPAAVPQYELRGFGTSLWFNKAVTAMNAVMPVQYRDSEEPPFKDLESLEPDLILAVKSALTRKQYEELSQIAPVVAYPGAPFGTDRRMMMTMVGAAIGKPQGAKRLVEEVDEGISKARSSYDVLDGPTFLYLGASLAPGADFEVYDGDSNPARILKDFGVVPAPVCGKTGRRKTETGRRGNRAGTLGGKAGGRASSRRPSCVCCLGQEGHPEGRSSGTPCPGPNGMPLWSSRPPTTRLPCWRHRLLA